MSSDTVLARNEVYSAMEMDRPFASYIKTILGKVAVTVWDITLEKPVDVILKGNPKRKDEECIVKVWSVKEDAFFKRVNQNHFRKGLIIPLIMEDKPAPEKTIEQATDDELKEIINSRFLALQNKLNKVNSIPVLFRMLGIAQDEEKSDKIIKAIEARISEVQALEYKPKDVDEEEE